MGTKGIEIVSLDVNKIIGLLNRAFADEWLAYYQYWIGAQIIMGPMKTAVEAELIEHANDEVRHADMLSKRIIQLGGTPLLDPKEWFDQTNCGYDAPTNNFVEAIIKQNIKGEQCAIGIYNELLKLTKDDDLVTYNIVLQILEDEVEHEEDLQALLEDLQAFLGKMK